MLKSTLAALSVLLCVQFANAQSTTAATDPVGFVSISIPAQTDYVMGFPLHRPSEFQGVIQSISGNTVTVAGTPGWTASQFVFASGSQLKTYYVRIDSGAKEGLFAMVTANDATSITVSLNTGDDLSGVLTNAANGSGDLISIIPYWTPSTLFSGMAAGTQLFLFPTNTPGINFSASTIYAFNGTNWKQGFNVADNTPLIPLQGMILRNSSASPISMAVTGSVPMTTNRLLMSTLAANTQQDIWFFYNSPVPEVIGNLNLGVTAGDQLMAFDNTATGFNKSPSQIVSWNGTQWKQGFTDVTHTYTLNPGNSYLFRKAGTASPSTYTWSSLPSYLAP